MAVVDFVVFHIAAVGLALAIYFGIPLLDDAISGDAANWTWLAIFRIVSPTVTLPGGAVTVLSTYFYARRIQEIEKEKQEETQQRLEAEAQVQTLKAQLERATAPHRRNRRRRPLRSR